VPQLLFGPNILGIYIRGSKKKKGKNLFPCIDIFIFVKIKG
jgi:hypothetical protein